MTWRAFLVVVLVLCAVPGCRKRKMSSQSGDGPDAPAPTTSGEATPGSGVPAKAFASPPPWPANAPAPVNENVQFYPPEPVNMYAPVRPGDYQAQLDTYNRVLRRWTETASIVPNDLNHLMGIYNSPKPPQPPAGRRLVFDRKTITVRLQ